MTDIRFYHLKTQTVAQALPGILTKALAAGHRIVVKLADDSEVQSLNESLWTFRPESFIPHGCAKDGHSAHQPIYITAGDDSPNNASVIILGPMVTSDKIDSYQMSCEIISDHIADAVTAARLRWKNYKDAGHDVTYWQQTETGGWEKKA